MFSSWVSPCFFFLLELPLSTLLLGDAGSGKARLADMLVGRSVDGKWESKSKGVGLDFRFCDVNDAGGDVSGRLNVWRLQGDVAEAARGELLETVAPPDVVVLAGDLSRPWQVLATLEQWLGVVEGQKWLKRPAVVVAGCKSDTLGEGPHDGLLRALRGFCVAHGRCALVFVSLVKGSNCALLRQMVLGQAVDPAETETDEVDSLYVPADWDTHERVDALPEAALPSAPAVAAKQRKEEETVVAESEQAFLLRHGKLLETLREEEQQQQDGAGKRGPQSEVLDAPGTPLAVRPGASEASVFSPAGIGAGGGSNGGSSSAFTTPLKTPFKPGGPSTPAAAALADVGDHAVMADYFNSLLALDNKSPHKGAKPK